MRKIIVVSFMTLDGVMQAPGGPDEDRSGNFRYGGWAPPYADDESRKVMQQQMKPTDILLGRKTFDIWEDYWPKHKDTWPGISEGTKYVLSNTRKETGWENTVFIRGPGRYQKAEKFRRPGHPCMGQ